MIYGLFLQNALCRPYRCTQSPQSTIKDQKYLVYGPVHPESRALQPPPGQDVLVHNAHGLFGEELLQRADDAAGLRQATVLGPSVLEQNVPVSTALQEQAAAEQRVVAHLGLPDKPLQVVHVLNGLRRRNKSHLLQSQQTNWIRLQLP